MPYRLYRREPIEKGKWYYSVTCKGCAKAIHILDDPGQGQSPTAFVGAGHLSIPCTRCFHDDLYAVNEVQVIQSAEDLPGTHPPRNKPSSASRKPLWKTYPSARATFGVGYIEDRPEAAAIVARIITAWADIEIQCARLLAELMNVGIPAAAAVFGSLRSSRAQQDALSAAAAIVLNSDDFDLFSAHMLRRAALEKERNDLTHGCYGVAVGIPHHIVWVAQSDYIAFTADNSDPEGFRRKQFVYELGTLERIASEIAGFYDQLGQFRGYLTARHSGREGEAFRALRYPQLCIQPHIREALDRVRTEKKGHQAP